MFDKKTLFRIGLLSFFVATLNAEGLPPLDGSNNATSTPKDPSVLETKELSSDDIDKIFLSFAEERERQKREREARRNNNSNTTGSYNVTGVTQETPRKGNPVFPRSGGVVVAVNGDIVGAESTEVPQSPEQMGGMGFRVTGVSCDKGKCTLFTNSGRYVVGDKLASGEKIISIHPKSLKVERQIMSADGTESNTTIETMEF
ncbi:MAG: hypothetical protein IE916_00270 [Epsilonproteobacteria bacterium]|nr:hypothetical protein [Campylobacterota bacterium]